MKIPKFLLGDNTDHPDAIFVVHTEFPRFIIDLTTDEVEWLEEFDPSDQQEVADQTEQFITEAADFYDREVDRYAHD
ncbi:hypothetical protein [Aureitalea marina]|uniref:Uncharacterized protein n=1 Tax=Aureitalea marina TaxID=930804 RepID=A0A2S7KML1_9FLAO|nr:hypothetical protein [Aureitalea marina]PQB03842.1 hypothetical protein BST85_02185 [Aureitalea marina]